MACGCLLVASDTSPVREFVEDGVTELLVPPHDPAALAARIETALDGAAKGGDALRRVRARARARAKIVGGFDAERVIWPKKRAWLEGAAYPDAPAPARARPAGRRR